MGRVLLGGIVGGLLVFICGFVSHAVLKLAEQHVHQIPNEQRVADTVRDNIPAAGIYYSPWMDPADNGDEAKTKEWEERFKAGPYFFLVRGRDGEAWNMTRALGFEYASNFLAALIASLVVAAIGTRVNVLAKSLLVGLLGMFAWLSQDVSYWIWHQFPQEFVVAELVTAAMSWLLAGIAIALIVRPARPA
jgi:hypothetical protein